MSNKAIKGCTFHHVALQASNFERSLKFYTEGLGFEVYRTFVTSSGKTASLIDIGEGSYFEIFSGGEKAAEKNDSAGTFLHLALKVDNASEAYKRALEYGGTEMGKAPRECVLGTDAPIYATIGFIKGPDGEEIELFQENVAKAEETK